MQLELNQSGFGVVSEEGMRNHLQFVYSVFVFVGVLVCSFFLVSRESDSPRIPMRAVQVPSLRLEASSMEPALNNLFDIEQGVNILNEKKAERDYTMPNEPHRKGTEKSLNPKRQLSESLKRD